LIFFKLLLVDVGYAFQVAVEEPHHGLRAPGFLGESPDLGGQQFAEFQHITFPAVVPPLARFYPRHDV
jgi:hypothetical protein